MYKKEIAGEEEVLSRVIKNLQEKHDTFVSREVLQEVYDSTVAYIRKRKKEIPFCSIKLGDDLGRAYWPQTECTRRKHYIRPELFKNEEDGKKQFDLWQKRYDMIEEYYQNNQPKKNVSKFHRNYHIIQPLIKSISRRKILMEDVEKIQNSI